MESGASCKHLHKLQAKLLGIATEAVKFACPILRKEEGHKVEYMGTMEFLLPQSWALALEQGAILEELTCSVRTFKYFGSLRKIVVRCQKNLVRAGLEPPANSLCCMGMALHSKNWAAPGSRLQVFPDKEVNFRKPDDAAWPKQSATPATEECCGE